MVLKKNKKKSSHLLVYNIIIQYIGHDQPTARRYENKINCWRPPLLTCNYYLTQTRRHKHKFHRYCIMHVYIYDIIMLLDCLDETDGIIWLTLVCYYCCLVRWLHRLYNRIWRFYIRRRKRRMSGKIALMTVETIVYYYIVLHKIHNYIKTHAQTPNTVNADSKNNETNALDCNKSSTNTTWTIRF